MFSHFVSYLNLKKPFLFSQGIAFSMTGPTLLDLQELTHSETDEISIVLITKSVSLLFNVLIYIITSWNQVNNCHKKCISTQKERVIDV